MILSVRTGRSLKVVNPYFKGQGALIMLDFAPERSPQPTGADLRAGGRIQSRGAGCKSWLGTWCGLALVCMRAATLFRRLIRCQQQILTTLLSLTSSSSTTTTTRAINVSTPSNSHRQHVIPLMELSSSTALLQNAVGTTISEGAQVINAGHNVILHNSPAPPAAGMSGFI